MEQKQQKMKHKFYFPFYFQKPEINRIFIGSINGKWNRIKYVSFSAVLVPCFVPFFFLKKFIKMYGNCTGNWNLKFLLEKWNYKLNEKVKLKMERKWNLNKAKNDREKRGQKEQNSNSAILRLNDERTLLTLQVKSKLAWIK